MLNHHLLTHSTAVPALQPSFSRGSQQRIHPESHMGPGAELGTTSRCPVPKTKSYSLLFATSRKVPCTDFLVLLEKLCRAQAAGELQPSFQESETSMSGPQISLSAKGCFPSGFCLNIAQCLGKRVGRFLFSERNQVKRQGERPCKPSI